MKFAPLTLAPDKDLYQGKDCPGVLINITDNAAVRALDVFVHAAYWLREYNEKDFKLKEVEIRKMTGSSDLYAMLEKGRKPAEIIAAFEKSSAAFREAALKFRLYK